MRWQRGELTGFVEGRCKATNLCKYCQRLYVVETVEMLTLDAMESAPTLWFVLTAREHLLRKDTYRHLEHLRRAARKRWPEIEWFIQVEFQRRGALHLNLLVKGVETYDRFELERLLIDRWCDRVDAERVGQWMGVVQDGRGVVLYISKMLAHGLKAEQAPPVGWKGHRTSQTRGYLVRPASQMRIEAREALRQKRDLHRVLELQKDAAAQGVHLDAYDLELELNRIQEERAATSWDLHATSPRRAELLLAMDPRTGEIPAAPPRPAATGSAAGVRAGSPDGGAAAAPARARPHS